MHRLLCLCLLTTLLAPAPAVADLWQDLARYRYGDPGNAPEQLAQLVQQTPPSGYPVIESRLVQLLQSDQATTEAKAFACRMLQRIGTRQSIPALAGLLHHDILSHYARLPLESMGAVQPIRQALDGAPDGVVPGLIGSLGRCRDAQAVGSIARFLHHANPDIVTTALRALGQIGTADALQALEQAKVPPALQPFRYEAQVACAARLGRTGYATLNSIHANPAVCPSQRIAALKEMLCIDQAASAPLVVRQIQADPSPLRRGTLRLVVTVPGGALTEALVQSLDRLDTAAQAELITLLGKRGDRSALPAVQARLASGNPAVRAAAIEAVSDLGGAGQVRPLLELARSQPDSAQAVTQALARMGEAGVDRQLLDLLDEPALKGQALSVLAQRGYRGAGEKVLQLTEDADARVRLAAWQNMPALADEKQMPALVDKLLAIKDPAEQQAARSAVKAICAEAEDRAACFAPIAQAYAGADPQTRLLIVSLAPSVGTAQALALERSALAGNDAELRKAALRALAVWPNDAPADDLLAQARQAKDPADRIIALRGFIEVAARSGAADRQVARYRQAAELAVRTEEKRLLIAKLQDCRHSSAFQLLQRYAQDPAVKDEAAMAMVNLAARQAVNKNDRANVLATLRRIAESAKDAGLARRARDVIKRIESGRRR